MTTRVGHADDTPTPSVVDKLIADVLPLRSNPRVLAALEQPDEVAVIQVRKPQPTENWRQLAIGEFESNEAFARRQKLAKDQEQQRYAQSLREWETSLSAAHDRVAARRRQSPQPNGSQPTMVAVGTSKPLGTLMAFKINDGPLQLPLFDRNTMSFQFPIRVGSFESAYRGDKSTLASLRVPEETIQIKVTDFEVAKKIKESLANDKASLYYYLEPQLTEQESPIVVKAARTERVLEKAASKPSTSEKVIVAGIAALLGGDANSIAQSAEMAGMDRPAIYKDVNIPAEIRPGVRFHFTLKAVGVALVDENSSSFPNTEITILGRNTTSVRVEDHDSPIQEAAKVLRRGDQILSVAGKPVRTVGEYIAATKEQANGKSYVLTYRSVIDGREYDITVVGGKPVGLSTITAY